MCVFFFCFCFFNLTSQAYPHTDMHVYLQLLSVFLNCEQIDHLDAAGSHSKPNAGSAFKTAQQWRWCFVSLDPKRDAAEGSCWGCNWKKKKKKAVPIDDLSLLLSDFFMSATARVLSEPAFEWFRSQLFCIKRLCTRPEFHLHWQHSTGNLQKMHISTLQKGPVHIQYLYVTPRLSLF